MSIENVYDLNRYIQMQYTNTINILFALSRLRLQLLSLSRFIMFKSKHFILLQCLYSMFYHYNRLNTVKLLDYYLGLKTLNLKILKRYML